MPYAANKTGWLITMSLIILALPPIAAAASQQDNLPLQPQALDSVGLYDLRKADPNLTGSGIRFAVVSRSLTYINGEPQNDYRPDSTHNCFVRTKFRFNDQAELPAGISLHSTAVCSILLGEDPNASHPELGQFHYQGAAPEATADIYEFWHFLINNVFPGSAPQADVITASFGNQFQDWWTRGIESLVEHHGLIVTAGIGNGSNSCDFPLYPAACANVIGVGVVDCVTAHNLETTLSNFSLAYPEHSSFGPTEDGRCKPDIVAPGNCLAADPNNPDRYEPTGSWSSFSTPIVAGTIGLLLQKARQDPNLAPAASANGGNCLIKTILLNSAAKLPFWHKGRLGTDDDHQAPLDYIQGAGMLDAAAAYHQLTAGQSKPGRCPAAGWDLNTLNSAKTLQKVYRVSLDETDETLITATIAWNRHYSPVYPFESLPQKDANFRLELWAVDPDNQTNDYLLDYSDSPGDNVEHIYHQADPEYTTYDLVVSYSDAGELRTGPLRHLYALAWSATRLQKPTSTFWYDLNSDGLVDPADFTILLNNWLAGVENDDRYRLGDINADGLINIEDLQILANHSYLKADWYPVDAEH